MRASDKFKNQKRSLFSPRPIHKCKKTKLKSRWTVPLKFCNTVYSKMQFFREDMVNRQAEVNLRYAATRTISIKDRYSKTFVYNKLQFNKFINFPLIPKKDFIWQWWISVSVYVLLWNRYQFFFGFWCVFFYYFWTAFGKISVLMSIICS